MARFAALKLLVNRLRYARQPQEAVIAPVFEHTQLILNAVHKCELAGQKVTLRTVHKIADMSQSDALRTVSELEKAGKIRIAHKAHDAFESVVSLSPETSERMKAISRRNAA